MICFFQFNKQINFINLSDKLIQQLKKWHEKEKLPPNDRTGHKIDFFIQLNPGGFTELIVSKTSSRFLICIDYYIFWK